MATATMATAAGAAMILYFVLSRTVLAARKGEGEGPDGGGDVSKSTRHSSERRRLPRRPAQPPATWREAVGILSETLRFTYSETLGKWPIGDLAFGIKYLMRRQGDLQVASIYAGDNCKQLKGPEVIAELTYLLRLLSLCMLFSKKPFPVFLESAGYTEEDVLLQEPKAGLLKPAFTILRDKNSKCLLLLIRGTHSIKDTLTAATGAVVPFHHSVVHEGGVSNLVLGYAHCGMVAAACWIAKCTTPCLLKAVCHNPDYNIKVVGHSLGGGTAALLTYILREYKELSSSTCVAFAPAACMTWDLAESGKHFITTIVNSSDLVPTFSTASIDDLRSEVTASSWVSDLRDQVEHTRFLNVVFRSVIALGARLPSICSAKARVAGAGALLRPVSSSTQIVMKRAQNVAQAVVRTRSSLSSWSCMGARRRVVGTLASPKDITNDSTIVESIGLEETDLHCSEYSARDTEEEEQLIRPNHVISVSVEEEEEMTEHELWLELEKELARHGKGDIEVPEEEAAIVEEITKEENVVLKEAIENRQTSSMDAPEVHRFYPPGLIMHMVAIPAIDAKTDYDGVSQESIGIYLTPRDLYSKLRLSRTMINDHYMPMYKKMMELLIEKLEKDVECCTVI